MQASRFRAVSAGSKSQALIRPHHLLELCRITGLLWGLHSAGPWADQNKAQRNHYTLVLQFTRKLLASTNLDTVVTEVNNVRSDLEQTPSFFLMLSCRASNNGIHRHHHHPKAWTKISLYLCNPWYSPAPAPWCHKHRCAPRADTLYFDSPALTGVHTHPFCCSTCTSGWPTPCLLKLTLHHTRVIECSFRPGNTTRKSLEGKERDPVLFVQGSSAASNTGNSLQKTSLSADKILSVQWVILLKKI